MHMHKLSLLSVISMWLDLQKLTTILWEVKSKLCPNVNDSLMQCYMSMNINCVAIDIQVCFHRWLFANSVKLSWCITGPIDPLASTNQNWLVAKLLPWPSQPILWFVYIPVVCWEHSATVCGLMAGSFSLPTHNHPLPPIHPPPYKHHPWYYRIVTKLSQPLAVNTARRN